MDQVNNAFYISHDGVGHQPLGAASYYFQDDLIGWLCTQVTDATVNIFIGSQPNSSPHMGTICNIMTAFGIGQHLQRAGKTVTIFFDAVDTAPEPQHGCIQIDGHTYQRSLRWNGLDEAYLAQFCEILQHSSRLSGVPFTMRKQAEILGDKDSLETLRNTIAQHEQLGALFSPKNGRIGVRAACPVDACGMADKAEVRNRYLGDSIQFYCPFHGEFSLNLHDSQQAAKLELNTPMRNLLRNRLFGADRSAHWIQVIGSDYAGFYQEQLLWRLVAAADQPAKLPLIIYSPAILDWSGAKLSKSLYVTQSAYNYLKGSKVEYMLSYDLFRTSGIALEDVYRVCCSWIGQPYKLFRAYTIYHLHDLLTAKDPGTSADAADTGMDENRLGSQH